MAKRGKANSDAEDFLQYLTSESEKSPLPWRPRNWWPWSPGWREREREPVGDPLTRTLSLVAGTLILTFALIGAIASGENRDMGLLLVAIMIAVPLGLVFIRIGTRR
jgi:hypothetical protein